MSFLKKLASDSAIYGVSSVLGRILNYLLVPLHTGVLAEESYGVISLFYTFVAFLNAIYAYGMETAYFNFASQKGADRKKIYWLILSTMICSSLLFSGLLILFSSSLAGLLDHPQTQEFIVFFAFILALDAIMLIPFARLRLENKAKKFALIKSLGIVMNVGFNMFFLFLCHQIYKGSFLVDYQEVINHIYNPDWAIGYIFLANLVASALMFLLLWKDFLDFRFYFNFQKFKPVWVYAYPILFTSLAAIVNELVDRTLLEWWLPSDFYPHKTNTEIVGIYAACYKLSIFITLAVQAFKYAAEPFFFAQASDKKSPQVFAKVLKFFVISCLLMFLGVSLNLDILGTLFLRQAGYREGLLIVPILLMANIFLGIYYNLAVWFKVSKTATGKPRTYFGTFIGLSGATVTLIANLVLIPYLGYVGSALATLASYFTMATLCYLLGQRFYPIPYPVGRILGYLLFATVLVCFGLWLEMESIWLQKVLQFGLVLVFLGVTVGLERSKFRS